ncbi:dTDP-4-dehydrorhamnose 3,5-epimerase family protein [Chryseosolibacter indicus]|uniref:dTDP-4-dehydrorhamnose 3,5-epimerase family protein n=1 Tax=Chryseosolibacter indicus TaxID=2782351 RepID=A0ABS5VTY2_9BACT|nr:dTDP-4-dehydrorhamnose 3,5-epimerase family protein [Chryseosolibacter indicus]MBT1704880.1 dTDP-4-dehydrorhamnose 3,5-epimerase family protein [Chryseosolibacter indicus]
MDTITSRMDGVLISPIKIIPNENGDVLHGLKASEDAFVSFGEAYFSIVHKDKRKGWKKHTRMTLNLVVPVGEIGFILFDDREGSGTYAKFFEISLSRKNYCRLTVPPGIWMAFYGKGADENILLNIASIPHDPEESINLPLINDHIKYQWQ